MRLPFFLFLLLGLSPALSAQTPSTQQRLMQNGGCFRDGNAGQRGAEITFMQNGMARLYMDGHFWEGSYSVSGNSVTIRNWYPVNQYDTPRMNGMTFLVTSQGNLTDAMARSNFRPHSGCR